MFLLTVNADARSTGARMEFTAAQGRMVADMLAEEFGVTTDG